MAHLKKSSTTGHLLKNSAGHLVNGCDCTCNYATLPSPIICNLTNLVLSGCTYSTCTGSATARWYLYQQPYSCYYYKVWGDLDVICWDGHKVKSIYISWSDSNCRWEGTVSSWNLLANLVGPSTPQDPSGTYTVTSGCASGSLEIE